jgi:hypothetical protein
LETQRFHQNWEAVAWLNPIVNNLMNHIGRFSSHTIPQAKCIEPIREPRKLSQIAGELGLQLSGWADTSELHGLNQVGFFTCPNGGNNKIFKMFADGSVILTSVPPWFDSRNFQNFLKFQLPRLMEKLDLTEQHAGTIAYRMEEIFEGFFEMMFPIDDKRQPPKTHFELCRIAGNARH